MRRTRMAVILSILMLCTLFSGCGKQKDTLTPNDSVCYYLYVGLIDADTGKQVLTTDEAQAIVKQTLISQKAGATMLNAWGDFLGSDGQMQANDTILIITSTAAENIEPLVNELKSRLNISTVYIEKYTVRNGIIGGQL